MFAHAWAAAQDVHPLQAAVLQLPEDGVGVGVVVGVEVGGDGGGGGRGEGDGGGGGGEGTMQVKATCDRDAVTQEHDDE